MKAYFLTGTDTGIGKTTVACALLARARQQGLSSLGLKPVASGCESTPDGLRNSDALLLQAASSIALSYPEVNPVALAEPLSPHLAARAAGRRLSIMQLTGHVRAGLSHRPDLAIVEGAGGWRVPISDREMLSSLPKELRLPVIMVVGLRLGCLNHAVLTAEAILRDGLRLAGWVANRVDPDMVETEGNLNTLRNMLPAPCLGVLPYRPGGAADEMAEYLDISTLLPPAPGAAAP
ncbi:MAG TPA: dethiobiotin synthase [Fluviicoccus sp.]|nr:dethiobiotin synthase [Fluviicoccus sp.]